MIQLLLVPQASKRAKTNLQDVLVHLDRRDQIQLRTETPDASVPLLLTALGQEDIDLCILELDQASMGCYQETLQLLAKSGQAHRILIASVDLEEKQLGRLLAQGFGDFSMAPFRAEDLHIRLQQLVPKAGLNFRSRCIQSGFIGESPAFQKVVELISKIADCNVNILIWGETGTGKEVCAKTIHTTGKRASRPFIPVNCGAIPTDLFENELFGHLPGSYTGAHRKQAGLVEEAAGGTLFLDEVDCLPLSNQVKLLRFLQEREYRPIGTPKVRKVDVRIIAAANRSLDSLVERGQFRQDLFFRLNTVPIHLPNLKQRRDDIPILANFFLQKYAARFKKKKCNLTAEAMLHLAMQPWRGNIRELEHVIQRAVVLSDTRLIREGDLQNLEVEDTSTQMSFRDAKRKAVTRFEIGYLRGLLAAHSGNVSRAARSAGKDRRALWELIRKHGMDMTEFRARPPKARNNSSAIH